MKSIKRGAWPWPAAEGGGGGGCQGAMETAIRRSYAC